jgi:hypothetical protein
MAETPVQKSVREALEKKEQYENFKATGKYRWQQIGIDKGTGDIVFYSKEGNEIYDIPISQVATAEKQILMIDRLLEKRFFTKKVLKEFLIALAVLKA